jgi:hypothetical protein
MSSILLQQLTALETAVAYTTLPPPGQTAGHHSPGHIPILLSAPHSTAHQRNGRIKEEEEFTAAFVQYLAAQTGAHAFYAPFQSAIDPNWYKDAPYKSALQQVITRHNIRFVLDVHGMSNRYKIGLALGTMNGRSCPQHETLLVDTLAAQGFAPTSQTSSKKLERLQWNRLVLNHNRFTGGLSHHTVTRFVAETMGVAAAQLELCSMVRIVKRGSHRDWRIPFHGDPQGIETAVCALITLINRLNHALQS